MVCPSPARAMAVKLLRWLTRILKAFRIPLLSGDAFRRALSILLHIYRSVTKPAASDSRSTILQSQAYCANSLPASTYSSEVDIRWRDVPLPPSAPPSTPPSTPPPLPTPPSEHGIFIWPTAPGRILEERYAQRVKVERRDDTMKLKAKKMDYDEPPVDDWVRCTQPEGSSYFLNSSKRILTDADISKRHTLKKINIAADILVDLAGDMFTMHDEIQLVIGVFGQRRVLYYFVDHKRQLLFWVHDSELSTVSSNVKDVTEMSHIKYAIETQYWTHLELYPNLRKLKAEHQAELKGILIHASTDALISNSAVVPFSLDALDSMVNLVDKFQGSIGIEDCYAVYVVAKLMRNIANSRSVNFHGQPQVRLGADKSVYTTPRGEAEATSLIITIFDFFLFGGPSAHASELRKVWTGQAVNFPLWKGFICKLRNEWTGFTIYSTVMLSVDISFLANPALNPDVMTTMSEAANILTYLSLIFVVGSLVVSLQLSNGIRGQETSSAWEAANMMATLTELTLGTDALVIMCSLPFAFLVWGMISFTVALGLVVFGCVDHIAVLAIAPGAIIVGLLTIWPSVGIKGKYTALRKLWIQSSHWLKGSCTLIGDAV